jgi:acetoin utilization deacetylase AcuC-like enzyme
MTVTEGGYAVEALGGNVAAFLSGFRAAPCLVHPTGG